MDIAASSLLPAGDNLREAVYDKYSKGDDDEPGMRKSS
jgi:hypothetical protein